ncbi:hypothetical protein GCM10016455_28830 [Aliiroseovarius zhejiangensis]|uniref:Uncharacterized protein n=1 Tax=Aliiroseovarius zhejiangensis TaxID=1632025 RepID=A0ABQ3J9Q3_9RHOB|nr:hypothetical protein GCM10016455_28830 [Aliiroseovarius zhejiangensis]
MNKLRADTIHQGGDIALSDFRRQDVTSMETQRNAMLVSSHPRPLNGPDRFPDLSALAGWFQHGAKARLCRQSAFVAKDESDEVQQDLGCQDLRAF